MLVHVLFVVLEPSCLNVPLFDPSFGTVFPQSGRIWIGLEAYLCFGAEALDLVVFFVLGETAFNSP